MGYFSEEIETADLVTADILRIEAGFMLFCNEFSIKPSVLEITRGRFMDNSNNLDYSSSNSLVCFKARSANDPILWHHPNPHPPLPQYGEILITSACISPLANSILGLGFVKQGDASKVYDLIDPLDQFHDIVLCDRLFLILTKLLRRGLGRKTLRNISKINKKVTEVG